MVRGRLEGTAECEGAKALLAPPLRLISTQSLNALPQFLHPLALTSLGSCPLPGQWGWAAGTTPWPALQEPVLRVGEVRRGAQA